jgi:Flp pilus assembly protein TadB
MTVFKQIGRERLKHEPLWAPISNQALNWPSVMLLWLLAGILMLIGYVAGLLVLMLVWLLFPLLRYRYLRQVNTSPDAAKSLANQTE